VAGVQNIQVLKELLVTMAGEEFEFKVLQDNQVKIQPKSSDKYTTIIKALDEKSTEFRTYQPKADRHFRTVLRGLHYSTNIQDMKSEIESLGHSNEYPQHQAEQDKYTTPTIFCQFQTESKQ
jgi:predicted negative regulator of RcsB-dependent stress response